MATTVGNIHIGQGEIYVGGTAPTAGSDPNDPTAGTPSALVSFTSNYAACSTGGTHVGFTNGPATITYRPTYYMVETEQAMAEVVAIPVSEEASIAATMLEATYQNLSSAMGQGTTRTTTGPNAQVVYLGSKSVLQSKVFVILSKKRSGTGYYVVCVYQGYSSEGTTIPFERRAEMRIPLTMRALADTTRPVGDQLFQLVAYDANP